MQSTGNSDCRNITDTKRRFPPELPLGKWKILDFLNVFATSADFLEKFPQRILPELFDNSAIHPDSLNGSNTIHIHAKFLFNPDGIRPNQADSDPNCQSAQRERWTSPRTLVKKPSTPGDKRSSTTTDPIERQQRQNVHSRKKSTRARAEEYRGGRRKAPAISIRRKTKGHLSISFDARGNLPFSPPAPAPSIIMRRSRALNGSADFSSRRGRLSLFHTRASPNPSDRMCARARGHHNAARRILSLVSCRGCLKIRADFALFLRRFIWKFLVLGKWSRVMLILRVANCICIWIFIPFDRELKKNKNIFGKAL